MRMSLSTLSAAMLLFLVTGLAAAPSEQARAGEFPFEAYVATDQAEVASGPGRRFYVTDRLPRGATVQVHGEDAAGWLAIQPPEGSFSWILAEHVELMDDDVGKVKSPTESWIGTNIERLTEHKSQVMLKVGELVQVLEQRTTSASGGKPQAWLKIAPPAGEFRYVFGRDVSREPIAIAVEPPPPAEIVQTSATDDSGKTEKVDEVVADETAIEAEPREPERFRPSGSAIALRDIDEVRSRLAVLREKLTELSPRRDESRDGNIELAQFRATPGTAERSLSPDGFIPRKRRANEPLEPVPVPSRHFTDSRSQAAARSRLDSVRTSDSRARSTTTVSSRVNSSTSASSSLSPSASPAIGNLSSESVAQQLEQLDLELSIMVAQDKSTWNLPALRRRAEDLVEHGERPADRGTARILLDKIKQFETAFDVEDHGEIDGGLPAPGSLAAASSGKSAADPGYDGMGWLKPVYSKSSENLVAPYVIVDQDSKPLCFVTPSPGLNIHRYVNKQVGVYGKRGLIESLKTPHVLAERVIDLERQLR